MVILSDFIISRFFKEVKGNMSNNLLPAYAVFRVLANKKTSMKELLLSFISSFIKKEFRRNTFLINTFTPKFNEYYGFKIPPIVIKNVLAENQNITISKGGWYKIDESLINQDDVIELESHKTDIDFLISDFITFAKSEGYSSEKKLIQDFITYFNGSENSNNSSTLISKYIIETQKKNPKFKQLIDDLNYGSIIYRGITMDLSEINSWNKELVIYLNTDILFDIFGLNGESYQQSIYEFLNLVKEINKKTEYIKLKITNITIREINRFFYAAEKILCNKNQFSQSEGMDNLLRRCNEFVDIAEQRGLFFADLKKNDIEIDEINKISILNESSIYEEAEKENYINKNFSFFNFTDDYLDFIEKLRCGHVSKKLSDSKFIFLTRTEDIISKSKEKSNVTGGVRLAPTLEYLVTTLWFNLNKGFGVSELQSLDIVLKSKKIYAGVIADEKMKMIQEAKDEFEKKNLTEEQAYEVIASFKEVSSKPEDITVETIEEIDGLSNKSVNQILESNEIQRQKKQKAINRLTESNKINKEKLLQTEEKLEASNKKIEELTNTINENQAAVELGKKIQSFIKVLKKVGFIISWIIIHILLPIGLTIGLAFILKCIKKENKLDWSFIFSNWISLLCTFVFTEFLTWINRIIKKVNNKK